MGNQILGRRSRNFYRGFNKRQLSYLKQKFQSLSESKELKRQLFIKAYQLDNALFDAFSREADFDESGGISQYEFICIVSYFCNLTTEELGSKLFSMLVGKAAHLTVSDLKKFTSVCLKYNAYLQNKEVKDSQIDKSNKNKFRKYDYDKNKKIDCGQFTKICMKDMDYKNWLFNMGFITKNQMDHHGMIYDNVDSDIGQEIQRQLKENNPNVDRMKRGIDHRIQDDEMEGSGKIGKQTVAPTPWLDGTSKYNTIAYKQLFGRIPSEEAPSKFLTLEYVLGYRAFDCRNNLRFDKSDQIVYHQAALGMVVSPSKKAGGAQFQQRFLNEHKDDITCLDGMGDTIVTGECGTTPMIVIWNTKNIVDGAIKSEMTITKKLKQSVGTVCFSPSGNYLAATCNDEDHTLVIYDLKVLKQLQTNLTSKKTGIVCSGPLIKCLIFDTKFQIDEKTIAVATIKDLLFVNIEKGVINSSRGDFGDFHSAMPLCLLPLKASLGKEKEKGYMVSGMGNGCIYFWERGKCVKVLTGHTGSVSSICKRSDINSFISGDKEGKIIFWSKNFTLEKEIDLLKTNSPSTMIVSLSHGSRKQLLIGTKGSDILVLNDGATDAASAKSIMNGHSNGMVWTAAVGDKYLYTGGEDQRLLKWDYKLSRNLVAQIKCPFSIRSIDILVKANLLVVGFYNGVIMMYDAETLKELKQKKMFKQIKNPDQEVLNIVRFQTYGKFFVASYHYPEPKLIFFSFEKEIRKIGEIPVQSKILSLDITKSSKEPCHIRCNTSSSKGNNFSIYEFSFEKNGVKSSLLDKKLMRGEWATHTCPYSHQTKQFFSQEVEEKDITCCARSSKNKNAVIAGDRFSRLKLYNFPCPFNKIFNKYQGHSNAITTLMFNEDDSYFISVGGEEKSIFIWKYQDDQVYNQYQGGPGGQNIGTEEEVGVQSLSTPQYRGQIFAPSDFAPNPRRHNKVPEQSAKIHHVFGIRSTYLNDQVRNQGRFTADGRGILFPTACMAVKMDIDTKEQQIMLQHREDIVSFAVDSKRELMATGQMAEKNLKNPRKKILSIYVWDIQTGKSLVKLDGFHTIAVVLLEFSPSGKFLFSVGNDDKNTFAVYDWRAKTILYSGPVSRGKVNGISWKNESQFATCGNDHVKFWTNGKGRMGEFSPAKCEGQVSIASSGNYYISGGAKGNLFVWAGNKGPKSLNAHKGKIQCIAVRDSYVYTGADDGIILRWRKEKSGSISESQIFVDTRQVFAKRQLLEQQYGILSLDFGLNKNDNSYLFITKGCNAIVYESKQSKIVTQGHFKGQLWGLATNTERDKDIFVTGGDDSTLRIWSIRDKRQIIRFNNEDQRRVRGVDWSNDGQKIIFGDDRAQVCLLDNKLRNPVWHKGVPAEKNKGTNKGWIEQIKFSPDNNFAVYGSHGQSLIAEFLSIGDSSIKLKNKFSVGTSAFLHADWSRDSQYISYNSQAAELLFFNINQSKGSVSASSLKDEKWATWTQKFGFPVQGIFQSPDYTDVNTVCRDPTGNFIAVGYDDQCIRFFKYPCYIPKQVHKTFEGHSSHVTRIRFTSNYMVSTGGLDRTIIVWDLEGMQKVKALPTGQEIDQDDDGLSDLDDEVDLPRKIISNHEKKKIKIEEEFKQIQEQGDQFMAVKPWLGAIKEPTTQYPHQTKAEPKSSIKLEYVHGYRVKDCRQNLYFQDDKTLIFHAAAVLIYHDTKNNSQRLLTDHKDDILSIDYHKQTGGVITGELGPKPLVNYYRKGQLICSFKAPVTKGVLALSISPDGTKAVAAGMDDEHEVALLDLEKGCVIKKNKGTRKVILKLGWVSDHQFVSVGIRHFKFWTIDKSNFKGKDGKSPVYFVSLAIGPNKKVLTGASHGQIYSWMSNEGKKAIVLQKPFVKVNQNDEYNEQKTKASVVESISIQEDFIAAGTKDGFIFILDSALKKTLNCINLQELLADNHLKSQHPSVRSLDFLNKKMLVGTFGAQIYEIQADRIKEEGSKCRAICHMKNHYSPNNSWTNQVWGLYVVDDLVFTCSDDATVRCWSVQERRLLAIASLNLVENKGQGDGWMEAPKDPKTNDFLQSSKGRSICVSEDKRFIIVGCKEGTVRIFTFESSKNKQTITMLQKFKHAKQWISEIKFGFNMLIIGSHDNGIYVYDYDPEEEQASFKRKYRPMKKHSSYITHFDVSRDSCYLQSTCGAYQLLFWDLNTGKQITSGASMLRDERWKTWTCNLGWPVQGIYPKCTDGTFIHSVDRSNTSMKETNFADDPKTPYLLAAGNNFGQVCLYNFPCTIKNSGYVSGVGHSSHITNVRWTNRDDRVISVGGEDQCVMYWLVQKNN